ncbi:MAG TPA: MarR family transcriptional regulator [Candidatus Cloacimonadota bacterium]|nr:MarR family transcriptional regulator [Candidatus Cloacimonadota bacterium]HQB40210.1 MarR family transcriptional regulator [Candidatus Cloacimonadota bacterium]
MEKIEVGEKLNEVTNAIAKLMGNVEFMQRKCSKLGRVECNLLHILLHTNSMITMKELANKLGVTHSRVTHLIDSLERKDLVVRKQSDADRRIYYTQINDKGKTMVEKYISESVEKYHKVLHKLTDNERVSIYEALDLWLNLLKNLPQKRTKEKKR